VTWKYIRQACTSEQTISETVGPKGVGAGGQRGRVEVGILDLANSASIRAFATDVVNRYPRIDILVLNAGLLILMIFLDNFFRRFPPPCNAPFPLLSS
jgi:NAD(P)-dependent dehydrogenase (short-subunit alcohol dehydrogenase family)